MYASLISGIDCRTKQRSSIKLQSDLDIGSLADGSHAVYELMDFLEKLQVKNCCCTVRETGFWYKAFCFTVFIKVLRSLCI